MDQHDWLVERFEANRPHLRAVAYRMLGSVSAADQAVQDPAARQPGPSPGAERSRGSRPRPSGQARPCGPRD